MRRMFVLLLLIGLTGLLVVSAVSFAQQPEPVQGGNVVYQTARVAQGPEGPPPPTDTFMFMASEVNFEGKPVKGAPYSAQAVTETTQTLGDGNRIVNKTSSSVYRDSDGRTRREQTIKAIGPFGNGGEPFESIFINDPVAGISYALDAHAHIAHKSMRFKVEHMMMPPDGPGTRAAGPDGEKFNVKIERRTEGGNVVMRGDPLEGPPPGVPGPGPEGEKFTIRTESGNSAFVFMRKDKGPSPNVATESLGKQVIEGIEAEGTRTTITIPAGEIGNERAIEMVNERWYSAELQTVVMSRHSDPRSGETIYRLTNISRNEPAKSFFEVPADYTIQEGPGGPMPPGAMPARIRRQANPE